MPALRFVTPVQAMKCVLSPETNCPRLMTRPIPAARAASSLAVCTWGPNAIVRTRSSVGADAAKSSGSLNGAERSRQTMQRGVDDFSTADCTEFTETNLNPQDSAAPLTELMSMRSVEHRITDEAEDGSFCGILRSGNESAKCRESN